jgi:hypothetical protein
MSDRTRFGGLPPRYSFMMNPYPDQRISRCPVCEQRTGQRKLPLLIHINPMNLIALNYTCRYCKKCDLLVAHKHEIEYSLYHLFSERDPSVIGNDYLVVGTVEKKIWRAGLNKPTAIGDMLPQARDFVTYYQELRMTAPGWYKDDQEPRIMQPPPSKEWARKE